MNPRRSEDLLIKTRSCFESRSVMRFFDSFLVRCSSLRNSTFPSCISTYSFTQSASPNIIYLWPSLRSVGVLLSRRRERVCSSCGAPVMNLPARSRRLSNTSTDHRYAVYHWPSFVFFSLSGISYQETSKPVRSKGFLGTEGKRKK